jgi:hypothetical protein
MIAFVRNQEVSSGGIEEQGRGAARGRVRKGDWQAR